MAARLAARTTATSAGWSALLALRRSRADALTPWDKAAGDAAITHDIVSRSQADFALLDRFSLV